MESSIFIEGFHVPAHEGPGIVEGADVPDAGDTDRMALASYARAMDHVGTMAIDPHFRWLDRVILDLHFDACVFQRDRSPGLWRTGPIYVTSPGGGRPAYTGPYADDVATIMGEVVDWLQDGDLGAHVVLRAAMAHLHVVSVHPFADGNGRIARIVQSLVLARAGLLAPEFSSRSTWAAIPATTTVFSNRSRAAATNPHKTPPPGSASASPRTSNKRASAWTRSPSLQRAGLRSRISFNPAAGPTASSSPSSRASSTESNARPAPPRPTSPSPLQRPTYAGLWTLA